MPTNFQPSLSSWISIVPNIKLFNQCVIKRSFSYWWSQNGNRSELGFQLLKNLFLCFTQNVLLVDLYQPSHKFGSGNKSFNEFLVAITQALKHA